MLFFCVCHRGRGRQVFPMQFFFLSYFFTFWVHYISNKLDTCLYINIPELLISCRVVKELLNSWILIRLAKISSHSIGRNTSHHSEKWRIKHSFTKSLQYTNKILISILNQFVRCHYLALFEIFQDTSRHFGKWLLDRFQLCLPRIFF